MTVITKNKSVGKVDIADAETARPKLHWMACLVFLPLALGAFNGAVVTHSYFQDLHPWTRDVVTIFVVIALNSVAFVIIAECVAAIEDKCGTRVKRYVVLMSLLSVLSTAMYAIGDFAGGAVYFQVSAVGQIPIWMSFPIKGNKTLGAGKVLFNAKKYMSEYPGLPDGLAVAADGTIFGSGPGGIYVLTPKGKLIGQLITEGRTSNCTFDADGKTLYITADSYLCRVKMK